MFGKNDFIIAFCCAMGAGGSSLSIVNPVNPPRKVTHKITPLENKKIQICSYSLIALVLHLRPRSCHWHKYHTPKTVTERAYAAFNKI